MTATTGTDFQMEVALDRALMDLGKSLLEVPSTQNLMTLIWLSSRPFFAQDLDHFFTASMARRSFLREGSKPMVSMIRKGSSLLV